MLRQMVQPKLKDGLIAEMKRVGAYDVRIADPHQGFEYAPEGRHLLELMPDCKSVVVFVVSCADIPDAFFVGIRRSGPQAPDYWTQALHTENNELYACVRACPAGAYGDDGSYHGAWSREKCETTAAELMTQGYSRCTLCRTICPRGNYGHDELCVIDVRHSQPLSRLAYWVDRARGRVGVDVTPGTLQIRPRSGSGREMAGRSLKML